MTPRGYGAVWSALGAAALSLLVYQAVRGDARQAPSEAGPTSTPVVLSSGSRPSMSSALARSSPGAVVVALPAPPGPVGMQSSTNPASAAPSSSSAPPSSPPTSPSPAPLVAVSAVAALPVRSATPLEVRVGLVVLTGPPWPLLPGVDVTLGLP